tara:strand:+ start:1618 stop:2091 length:474 start_codon:yes stop_codon:yes gene_type:complete
MDTLNIKGEVTIKIKRNGKVHKTIKSNHIGDQLKEHFRDIIGATADCALDDRFSSIALGTDAGSNGKDGIVIKNSSNIYTTDCSGGLTKSSSGGIYTIEASGVGTWATGSETFDTLWLGFNWNNSSQRFLKTFAYNATSFKLNTSDTLDIKWKISIG